MTRTSGDASTGRVGIIAPTPPSDETEHVHLEMDASVLLNFHAGVDIFTRDTAGLEIDHPDVHTHKIAKPLDGARLPGRVLGYLLYQVRFSMAILRHREELSIVLFRGFGQLLPLLVSHLVQMFTIVRVAGVASNHLERSSVSAEMAYRAISIIEWLMCDLADVITVASPHIVQFAELEQYNEKICVWQFQYYDLDTFSVTEPFSSRDDVVGHVGTLGRIKGSVRFAEAMCTVAEQSDISTRVVGDGPQREQVIRILDNCSADATFTGRIRRNEIPDELNQMKLLVMPSTTEGVPKVMIESMACGTPVLATEVGGIPDFVEEGVTGFLLSDDDPQMIAERVLEILERDDLENISTSARDHVEQNVSLRNAVSDYHDLLQEHAPFDPRPVSETEIRML